jgi:hypothetical protein
MTIWWRVDQRPPQPLFFFLNRRLCCTLYCRTLLDQQTVHFETKMWD